VDDDQIAALNKTYLNREGPTNVIAFPMQEGPFSHIAPSLLGDVVVSVETAAKEGAIAGISVEERMMELLVHGILHLFGYDHETQDSKDALRMEKKNREILELISK
jgi:probable rRNA maturation factor